MTHSGRSSCDVFLPLQGNFQFGEGKDEELQIESPEKVSPASYPTPVVAAVERKRSPWLRKCLYMGRPGYKAKVGSVGERNHRVQCPKEYTSSCTSASAPGANHCQASGLHA